MAVNQDYLQYVIDQLLEFATFETKYMFGGVGFFHQGLMFGKIGGDIFRLRVDDINKADYEKKGMKPFYSEKMKKGMPYWEVPTEILDNKSALAEWASKSYQTAVRAAAKKKK